MLKGHLPRVIYHRFGGSGVYGRGEGAALGFRGLGFGVSVFGFRVSGFRVFGFSVFGFSGFRCLGIGFLVSVSEFFGFRGSGLESRARREGFGFWVPGLLCPLSSEYGADKTVKARFWP